MRIVLLFAKIRLRYLVYQGSDWINSDFYFICNLQGKIVARRYSNRTGQIYNFNYVVFRDKMKIISLSVRNLEH